MNLTKYLSVFFKKITAKVQGRKKIPGTNKIILNKQLVSCIYVNHFL